MKINKILLFIVVLCNGLCLIAQENSELQIKFANDLYEKSKLIIDINCEFSQTQSISIINSQVVKKGIFYYKRPEHLLLSFNDGDYIRMSTDNFMMKNAGRKTKIKIDKNPMLRELKKILSACMTGDVLQVSKEFTNVVTLKDDTYVLKMKPIKKRTSSRVSSIVLTFNKNNMCLDSMEMYQPNGDFTRYDFYDKKINTNFDLNIFDVKTE